MDDHAEDFQTKAKVEVKESRHYGHNKSNNKVSI